MPTAPEVRVWDPLVRLIHWVLVAAFAVGYATGDDWLTPHVWAGYVAGGAVALRLVWGLIGTKHARFTDFVYGPRAVKAYLADLVAFSARRYLGHSPAGGVMIVALLAAMAITVVTGLVLYGGAEQAGPLAPIVAPRLDPGQAPGRAATVRNDSDDEEHARGVKRGEREHALEEVHAFFADLTLFLVLVHVAGVLAMSFAHRENLVRAMVNGRKRALEPDPGAGS
jgi:cytochrome b